MDAGRAIGFCCGGCVLLIAGCDLLQKRVEPGSPRPVEPESEPIVVRHAAPDDRPAGDATDAAVREYIDRIDDIARRVGPPADAAPADGAPPPRTDGALGPPGADESSAASSDGARAGDAQAPSAHGAAAAAAPGWGPALAAPDASEAAGVTAAPPPPRVDSVVVRGIEPPPELRPAEAEGPAVNGAVRASASSVDLKEVLAAWLNQPGDAPFRAQLDRRLVLIATGEYEQARRPLEAVSDDQQELAGRLIEALIAVREGHAGDPAASASAALAAVEPLADRLRERSDLEIPALVVCREVLGYGRFAAIEPPAFPAGVASEFVLYCEVRNFASRQADDGTYHTRFAMRTAIMNRAGETVLEIDDPGILDRCRNRRRDCFIPRLVRLPATLAPGEYVAKVTLVDKLAEKVAENRTTFRVVAGP